MPATKRKSRPKPHKANRSKPRRPASPGTALAVLPPLPAPMVATRTRERELTNNEIELLKRTVAKGCSDDEFALFLWICRKHRWDPLTRQVHCVRYWLSKHHQNEKGVWCGGYQMSVQIGIDGFRATAARDHADFGGCDDAQFVMSDKKTPAGKAIPESATIRLWKRGLEHPIAATAYWEEFAPIDLLDSRADFYNRMPKHMLAKCAEALALRKGYPDLSNIYTFEEMTAKTVEYTEAGRKIIEPTAQALPADSLERAAENFDASNKHLDSAIAKEKKQLDQLREKNPGIAPPLKLTIVKSVHGAFHADSNSEKLDALIEQFGGTYLRLNRAFLVQAEQLEGLKKAAIAAGAEIREIDKSEQPAEREARPAVSGGLSKDTAIGETVSGILGPVKMDIQGRKGKFHTVAVEKKAFYCFSREMAEELSKHRGTLAVLEVEGGQYPQVKAIRKIGEREYDGVKPYASPNDSVQGSLI